MQFPYSAFAAYTQDVDVPLTELGTSDTYYSFDATSKTLTISGSGDMPAMANTGGGTASQPWYTWRSTSIDKVVVEEGVTGICSYAFCYIFATEFEIAESVKTIDEGAFYCANKTSSIVLPQNLEKIGYMAFYKCLKLESISIPKTVKSIGISAFEGCSMLNKVEFGSDYMAVTIGNKAFLNCPLLSSVTLPRNAKFSLTSYSFGFENATAGDTYDDFTIYAYRDSVNNSVQYRYAQKYAINFIVRDSMRLALNDVISREYFSSTLSDTMSFTFTPDVTDKYTFFSSGDVDVDCALLDSSGEQIGEYIDNSDFDRNFTSSELLNAGESYTYNVTSIMSEGEFSVQLIQSHSYISEVIEPDLYNDGYTLNTCIYCGYEYKSDFTERTGKDISGRVVLMEDPSGENTNDFPLYNVTITAGDYNTSTDEDGMFTLTVPNSTSTVTLSSPYGVDRTVNIDEDDLGDISFFAYDYVQDGYVNAKDYAWLRSRFGTEDKSLDYNNDGIIDSSDWSYAKNYLTYGKIDESIYS